jgi:hypothetical protein
MMVGSGTTPVGVLVVGVLVVVVGVVVGVVVVVVVVVDAVYCVVSDMLPDCFGSQVTTPVFLFVLQSSS